MALAVSRFPFGVSQPQRCADILATVVFGIGVDAFFVDAGEWNAHSISLARCGRKITYHDHNRLVVRPRSSESDQ